MVDLIAIAVSHGLLALAAWRLVLNDALDRETLQSEAPRFDPHGRAASDA